MLAGNAVMPNYATSSTMTGNSGNGYAKITYLSEPSSDSSLKYLKADKGEMLENFSPEILEYTIKLAENEYIVNFELETNNPLASVDEKEYCNILVPSGKSRHKINVYATDGTRTQYIINFEREASSYGTIDGITVNGKYYKFIDDIYDYEIVLPYDEDDFVEISADYIRPSQNILGLGSYVLKQNKLEKEIKVVSEDKSKTTTYNLNIVKENSNKLKSLSIAGIKLTPEFSPEIQNYNIRILSTMTDLDVALTAFDVTSDVKVTGNKNIPVGQSQILITVSNTKLEEDIVYTIDVESQSEISNQYNVIGNYEEFTTSFNGKYRIELWGAEGASGTTATGFGGYTSGEIDLIRGQKLYIYVGQYGLNGGYNGGGNSYETNGNAGGGATDVRLVSGVWDDVTSLRSRIMVAGGGGGHYGQNAKTYSASAGGLTGYDGTKHSTVSYRAYGATQKAGGSGSVASGGFGYGGKNGKYSDGHIGGGGRRRLLWRWWNQMAFTRWWWFFVYIRS